MTKSHSTPINAIPVTERIEADVVVKARTMSKLEIFWRRGLAFALMTVSSKTIPNMRLGQYKFSRGIFFTNATPHAMTAARGISQSKMALNL